MKARTRDSCCQLFKNLKTLPLESQYNFSVSLSIDKNRDLRKSYSEIHNINPQFISDLPVPTANLTAFQKRPFYFGIRVFNHLATSITNASHDIRQFKSVLKSFILIHSYYWDEYFSWNWNRDLGSV